jgi:hypothetical protein
LLGGQFLAGADSGSSGSSTEWTRPSHGKVAGVYALCAAQVALSREERAQLGGMHYRTQPAILLAQFARSDGSAGIGEEMLPARQPNRATRAALRRRDRAGSRAAA